MVLVEKTFIADLAKQRASKTEKYVLGPPSASQRHAKDPRPSITQAEQDLP
jgi:hypothetical protein